ncbi:uncharacterized protein LOC125047442 [Penaeus chinensis]|uniref:uncharacterized protein LOC125047442 n=1 Tax=Penaeus chinensis TaxID=139456 RepID=UPI001FB5812B|nr:uncharacterized protein LOC125047442 [Penaeus chinensis]
MADSEEELQRRCLRWQIGIESKDLKVNTKKTEFMSSSRKDVEGNIKDKDNARLKHVQEFKYLGVTVDARGEVWTMCKKEERILEATEINMLRRIKGVTLRERERSTDIRRELGVSDINEKVKKIRMRWYGHKKAEMPYPKFICASLHYKESFILQGASGKAKGVLIARREGLRWEGHETTTGRVKRALLEGLREHHWRGQEGTI